MKSKPYQIKSFITFIFIFSISFAIAQINPSHISGLQLWLRADSLVHYNISHAVDTMYDCSGNNNNAIQSTSLKQPLWVNSVINNKPVIRFNGTSDVLGGTTISNINDSCTIFIVASGIMGAGNYFIMLGIGGGSSGLIITRYGGYSAFDVAHNGFTDIYTSNDLPDPFPPKIFTVKKQTSGGLSTYMNGVMDNTRSGVSFTNANYNVGYTYPATYCQYWNGDIAEIIVYNRALSDNEKHQVEAYLDYKYAGSPVNLGSDINVIYGFCGTVIRAGKEFSSYHWSTGATSDSIIVNTPGTYSVTVRDTFGFHYSDTVNVTYPTINLPDTAYFCSGDSVLISTSLSGSYTYHWSTGKTTPSIYVKTPGNYLVTVTDASLCSKISNTTTAIKDTFSLIVSLGNDMNFCSGNSIGLQAGASQAVNYLWAPGGATTPTIPITATGFYSVTATDARGCSGRDTIHITINGVAPTVDFSYTSGCSNDSIAFTDLSSVALPALISSWHWNFGDGNTSMLQNPKHKFMPGNYSVKDSVVTSAGCSNIITKIIHVISAPVAAFTVDTACVGHDYTFTDQSSSAVGHINSWYWNFGDGHHSFAQDTVHTYLMNGNFSVTFTIQTDSGCQDIVTHQITVVSSAHTPSGFTLYLPSNNYITSDNIINFAWNSAIGAANYTLQYSTDSLFNIGVTNITNITTTSTIQTIGIAQKYFWRVIAYGICGNAAYSDVRTFTLFTPLSITGTQLWLKADSVALNDTLVTQWYDCSGSGNDAIQIISSNQPVKRDSQIVLNNKPIVHFDGINDFLNGTAISNIDDSSTIFIVASGNMGVGNYYVMFGIGGGANGLIITRYGNYSVFDVAHNGFTDTWDVAGNDLPNPFSAKIFTIKKQTSNVLTTYMNGVMDARSVATFTNANYTIGYAYPSIYCQNWNGDIAEIIVYNRALPDIEKKQVEAYLDLKYAGPPVNLGPDIWANNFCDTTLNASPRFIHYNWNTGNIGDTLSTLTVNTGGAYSVTVNDIFGYPSTDTIIVHKPIISAHDTLTCIGNSITLYAGLKAPFTFLWNGGSTADSLVVASPSTDTLTVTDGFGCQVTKVIHVLADSFSIVASLGIDTIKICTGDTIFLKTDAGSAISYTWYDGISYSHNAYYIVVWTSLTHHLYLTVTDNMGCAANLSVYVYVRGALPNVGFTYTPECFSPTSYTIFNDTSNVVTGSIINYNWSFGDGTTYDTSISNSFTHYYGSAGYYIVTLSDSTDHGCIKSVTHTVPVYSIPIPAFQPHIGCSGVPLLLKDFSTNTIGNDTSWHWTINDPYNPQTINATNALHTFDSTGWYHVNLVVTTQYGCKDSIKDSVSIRPSPEVGFSYSSVCYGNPVYFTDTSKWQPWYAVISWNWNFGSGQLDSIENPVHTFDTAGTYPVALTVKAINGCIVSETENVVVHAIPIADFHSPSLCAQTSATFHDSSSVLSPDHISSWLWSFGSIATSIDSIPEITFPDSGAYMVTLVVTSNAGCQSLATEDFVHVSPIPDAAFTADTYYGTPPFTVNFINNSQGAVNYLWNFGDSSPTSTSPTHTYNDTGIYVVSLIAYNLYSCTDTAYQKIYAIHTTADIAVTDVEAFRKGNLVSLSASLLNLGTRNISSIDLYAKSENGGLFEETWTDNINPLKPTESMTYKFNAQYELPDTISTIYFCVDAQIVGYNPDNNESNNEQCITLNSQFNALDPYPSPVHDLLNIDFILPTADNVSIELFGIKGDKIGVIFSGKAQKGLNKLTFDVSNLALGVYTYRILYKENKKVLKFVKY